MTTTFLVLLYDGNMAVSMMSERIYPYSVGPRQVMRIACAATSPCVHEHVWALMSRAAIIRSMFQKGISACVRDELKSRHILKPRSRDGGSLAKGVHPSLSVDNMSKPLWAKAQASNPYSSPWS
jgi:hypothetical protein